jgi:hypothetical protein
MLLRKRAGLAQAPSASLMMAGGADRQHAKGPESGEPQEAARQLPQW